jgi:hypothetical protein
MTDQIPYIKSEICPTCKKPFVPAPEHRYKIGFVKYCKPSCVPIKAPEKKSKYKKVGYANPRPVIAYTLEGKRIGTFPTIAEAGRALGIDPGGIRKVCDGKIKSTHKYTFKYKKKAIKS